MMVGAVILLLGIVAWVVVYRWPAKPDQSIVEFDRMRAALDIRSDGPKT